MHIQIDGTNTLNKGAELMLYSILEQIEDKFPQATVIFNAAWSNSKSIKTNLNLKQSLFLKYGRYPRAILFRLKLPYNLFTEFFPRGKVNLVLDASGFRHGDQWKHSNSYFNQLEEYYKKLKANNSKIILLPQAFGPFHSQTSKRSVEILNRYADLIIAREEVSKKFLTEAGGEISKILKYPDFTILSKGSFPEQFKKLKGEVCIIPNTRMLTHSKLIIEDYVQFIEKIRTYCEKTQKKLFLLNHEGKEDLDLCMKINQQLSYKIPIVTGLNAKQTKGIIGSSYLVISSRYHGVASALNQNVPCLATSWNHKYEMLFQDYGLNENIIDIKNELQLAITKVKYLLNQEINCGLRVNLQAKGNIIREKSNEMWKLVWETIT